MYLVRVDIQLADGSLVERGQVLTGDEFAQATLQVFLERGKVLRIKEPPLSSLPGWKTRGAKLRGMGVQVVSEFLKQPPAEIAKYMGVSEATAERWLAEVEGHLAPPAKKTPAKPSGEGKAAAKKSG